MYPSSPSTAPSLVFFWYTKDTHLDVSPTNPVAYPRGLPTPIPNPPLALPEPTPNNCSRLRQLLLPEPAEEARTHDNLRNQSDPEPRILQTMQTHDQIGEHGAGTGCVGSAGASDDGGHGTQDLSAHQGEDDVESSQRLEEDHAEADTLDGVEGSEP